MSEDRSTYDLVDHLVRQIAFSKKAFGPGERQQGVSDHIRKELIEIAESTNKGDCLEEWVDVILLALDGAWRSGADPDEICLALALKLETNQRRSWPDWRTADPDKAIEHITQGSD